MIYPSRAAVLTAAAGVPLTLVVAAAAPERWYAGLAWPVAVLTLTLVDAILAAGGPELRLDLPGFAYVGETRDVRVTVAVPGNRPPSSAAAALAPSPLFETVDDGRLLVPLDDGRGAALLPLTMVRRGHATIDTAWLRWRGPLGLAWRQITLSLDVGFPILPDIRPVRERGAQIFQRQAMEGLITQMKRGEGSDFDALVEFRSGMDRRAIDWKQSARHMKLHAKEYRTERNAQIVFAIDAGRQMSEPVAGLPRVDRAVSAALLTGWLALKLGDRVALHAFDSRPRIGSGLVSGAGAFTELQRLAADIDYSGDETNYTFALTTLATRLTRRSMIVLFTEFTDLTSADFMVRAARRMVETHLLLVVVLRDEELETIADAEPAEPDDVTRAVTAAALLRDRRLALTRLQHLGVHVIESEHDRVGERLVAGYIDLKRRNLL
ncbi:MAG: DUF58 domain-containing protein [Alphaproteobacteria bacterium]|nr:DUF58 domain-containing protein [Alphaproteobacteria bacterium]MBV9370265.1 DUF58 domain-containing protein [Alphaproteobacteria bacterium]MBV9899750.1 DUF58 domain-containing protein [Alphaproteobacteria bacterium]